MYMYTVTATTRTIIHLNVKSRARDVESKGNERMDERIDDPTVTPIPCLEVPTVMRRNFTS